LPGIVRRFGWAGCCARLGCGALQHTQADAGFGWSCAGFSARAGAALVDQDGTLFYVLNVNGDLLAIYARSLRHTRCQVNWDERRGEFIDPCLGTRFLPTGEYQGGGPPQELVQLPVQVKDGQVWVEINFPKK
jgi:hypothetical protein